MRRRAANDIEGLLAHEGFLRQLAARLVSDPQTADDIVQETWLAALSRPPGSRAATRGWLATVARNVARMGIRSSSRRTRRERQAARPESAASPASVIERERARRTVLSAVLRLDEPYRTTVILRYYEGLPPREVARRLDVPVETVRTRTRRALVRMREDLDQRHESRKAWGALIAPLATPSAPATATATTAAGLGGLFVMSTKIRALALGLIVLLGAGGIAFFAFDLERDAHTSKRDSSNPSLEVPTSKATLAGRPADEDRSNQEAAPTGPTLDIFRKTRDRGVIRGIVLSGRTHEPVAGARVTAVMERGKVPDGMLLGSRPLEAADGETDARGRFVIEGIPMGAYRVRVTHPEEGSVEAVGLAAADPHWMRLYPLPEGTVDPVYLVRIVDEAGHSVLGARVECVCGIGTDPIVTESDGEGIARIAGIPYVEETARGWITASTGETLGRIPLALDRMYARRQEKPEDVVLRRAGLLEGQLVGPAGVDLKGTPVAALSLMGGRGMWANVVEHNTLAAEDGSFRFEPLPHGTYTLLVRRPAGLRMDLVKDERMPSDWAPLTAKVEAGATTSVQVPLVLGGAIRGRVVRVDGEPVPDCRIEIHLPQGPWDYVERSTRGGVPLWRLDSLWPDSRRFELTWRVLRTDAEGRYELTGLLPGPYRVRAVPSAGLSFDRQEPVAVGDGEAAVVEHRVEPAGTLELVARPFASLGLRREGSSELTVTMITPRGALGALTIPGLPVGAWELLGVHSDPAIPSVPLATFEVRERELTYVDATNVGNSQVRLRLLERGVPVAGALVDGIGHGRSSILTDADGWAAWPATDFGKGWSTTSRVELPHPDAISLAVPVSVMAGDVVVSVPTGRVQVQVRDVAGRWVQGARVELLPPHGAKGENSRAVQAAGGPHDRSTDPSGVARWCNVPDGEYRVEVRLPDTQARAWGLVTVGDGPAELEIQVPEPGVVRLRVLGEDGEPASGVRVGCAVLPAALAEKGWDYAVQLTENGWRTDRQGVFTVRGAPQGTARVYAWVMDEHGFRSTHNAQTEVEVAPGVTVEVELRLRPTKR